MPTVPEPVVEAVPASVAGLRLLSSLGQGGMASVYLAYDSAAQRRVAVKLLSPSLAGNPAYVARFGREGKIGAKLKHFNIVATERFGHDRIARRHFIVQELIDGPSCQSILDGAGALTAADAVNIALGVARALEYLHRRRLIHRDIKPDNILLTSGGASKLIDFGLVKDLSDPGQLTACERAFGTPWYMPYEQTRNAAFVDARSDLFALGATLYHLVTGQLPFPGETHKDVNARKLAGPAEPASRVRPSVPAMLDPILARLLAFNPEDRFASATELIVALERTRIAAPVLSFVDPESTIRSADTGRTTHPATVPDLQPDSPARASAPATLWTLRTPDRCGRWSERPATTNQILHDLRERLVPVGVEAARAGRTRFRPLAAYPEFHTFAAAPPTPTPSPAPPCRSRFKLLAGAWLGVAIAASACWLARALGAP